jgi:hypothetical protein
MNVETGTEATQFPEKEYINGIFLAVCSIVGLQHYKYFIPHTVHFFSETIATIARQAGQAVMPSHLSLNMCVCVGR